MTTTAHTGAHPDPSRPASAAIGPTCVACDFVDASLRRRIFFTLVDGLGEFWFMRAMQSGGYCLRHGRWMVAAGGGPALTAAYLDVIEGWSSRVNEPAGTDPRVGHACYLCETERWAEGFVLDLLARGDRDYARSQLGRLEPLCLRHLEPLVSRVPWHRVPEVAAQVASRRQEAADLPGARLAHAIHVVAGRDPNETARPAAKALPASGSAGVAPVHDPSRGWAAGTLSMPGLQAELDAGRCPACTAAGAAARNYLRWLADPEARPERFRDRDALCADHLHDAGSFAPLAAARALAGSLEHWRWTAQVLTGMAEPPPVQLAARLRGGPAAWTGEWRSSNLGWWSRVGAAGRGAVRFVARPSQAVDGARQLASQQRNRSCVACEAMATATTRSLELLGTLLAGPAGVRSYEETKGLCLRHVDVAWRRLDRGEREVIQAVARARARQVRWELQEEIRKSSWSVRYEPAGPETSAWQRALTFVLGEDSVAGEVLATEVEPLRRSA